MGHPLPTRVKLSPDPEPARPPPPAASPRAVDPAPGPSVWSLSPKLVFVGFAQRGDDCPRCWRFAIVCGFVTAFSPIQLWMDAGGVQFPWGVNMWTHFHWVYGAQAWGRGVGLRGFGRHRKFSL